MATPNYAYEKRQRELAKKRKQEEKRQKKLERKDDPADNPPTEGGPATPSTPGQGSGNTA
ncbi:MAG: hypothetical protein AB1430_04265 [Pseudomonadota bacterium]